MTKRKDPQPEALQPEISSTEPFFAEVEPSSLAAMESASEALSEAAAPTSAPQQSRRSGVLGPLLGGALAAIGGFSLAHFNVFGLAADDQAGPAALETRLAEAQTRQNAIEEKLVKEVALLSERLANLELAPPPGAPDLSRLEALDQRLAAIESIPLDGDATTSELSAKIYDLEQRLAGFTSGMPDPVLQQDLEEALARLDKAEAEAAARASEAEAAAQSVARAAGLDALTAAVASGQPYAVELLALADPALTAAMGTLAETGVSTLEELQASFPDGARQSLQIAREISVEDGWGDRLLDFLAVQTGARSLTPLEGDEPDAILSRAEFALSEGRVADAVTELDPLEPTIKAPLEPWVARAKSHVVANTALQAARGE